MLRKWPFTVLNSRNGLTETIQPSISVRKWVRIDIFVIEYGKMYASSWLSVLTYQIVIVVRHLFDGGKVDEREAVFWYVFRGCQFLQNGFVLKHDAKLVSARLELLCVLTDDEIANFINL